MFQSSGGTYNEGGTGAFFGQSVQREEIYSSGGSSRGEILSSGGSSMQLKKGEGESQTRGPPAIDDSDDDEDDEEEGREVEMKDTKQNMERGKGRVVGGQGGRRTTGIRQRTTTAAEEEREYRDLYALPTPRTNGGTLRDEVYNTHTLPPPTLSYALRHPPTHPQTHQDGDDDELLDLDYMTGPSVGIRGTVTGHRRQRYTPPSVNLLDSYMSEIESRGSNRR